MTSPVSEMDLPINEDTSPDKQKDMTSSMSTDTGFVSDGTFDSPISESGQDFVEIQDEAKQSASVTEETTEDVVDKEETEPAMESEDNGYTDILGNGLLRRKVLVPGQGIDSRPVNGDTVTLKISGKLNDGSQVEDGEISFTLNDGDVIVALDLGVALMEKGEKCELITAARYAYGELGREPDVPKNADITFTLELTDIKEQIPVSALTFEERLQQGENKRLRGNFLFGRGDYSGAINSFTKAVKMLDDTDLNAGLADSDREQLEEAWTKCYNNMAACQLKIDAFDAAIRSAEKVLLSQPKNVKALFRAGKAYGAKGQLESAIDFLKQAVQLDSESKLLHQELFSLTKKKNKETEKERDLYRKMLGVKHGDKVETSASSAKNGSSSMFKWVMAVGGLAALASSIGFAYFRNPLKNF